MGRRSGLQLAALALYRRAWRLAGTKDDTPTLRAHVRQQFEAHRVSGCTNSACMQGAHMKPCDHL